MTCHFTDSEALIDSKQPVKHGHFPLDNEIFLGRAVAQCEDDIEKMCCPSCDLILMIAAHLLTKPTPLPSFSVLPIHARSLGLCFHFLIGRTRIVIAPSGAGYAHLWLGTGQAYGRRARRPSTEDLDSHG